MSEVVACDISEFQPVVDDTYRHEWLIFRACDGSYTDQHAARNLAWALEARDAGLLRGFAVYLVFRPGLTLVSLAILGQLGVPDDCVLMIDAESWGGEIVGDHSTEINAFAARCRVRQQGRADLVWGYGNRGPDLTVWPHKPQWLRWVVASYGGSKPNVPNMAGWQYTDGQYLVTGFPSSSPPFGRCDHNVLYNPPEVDMPLTPAEKNELVTATVAGVFHHVIATDAKGGDVTFGQIVRQIRAAQDPAKLAAAVAAKVPGASKAQIEAAVREVFADASTP